MLPVLSQSRASRRPVISGGGSTFEALVSQLIGSPRNDYPGPVGFEFIPLFDLYVTAVGRWKISGNTALITLAIYAATTTPLDSVSVDLSTGINDSYIYANFGLALHLLAGTKYRCGSLESIGGDYWGNDGAVTGSSDLSSIAGAYVDGVWQTGNSGRSYVPTNFKYHL